MRLSASQIEAYLQCPRKWGWRYLDKVKTVQHPKAALGSRCHEVLEAWLKTHKSIDFDETMQIETRKGPKTYYPGRIVQPALVHLPPPSSALSIEQEIAFTIDGLEFIGYVDLAWQDDEGQHVIQDHKTCSTFQYAKLKDLLTDTQAVLYATHRLAAQDLDSVHLKWVYMKTEGRPQAFPIEATATRESVEKPLHNIVQVGKLLAKHKQQRKATLELEPNGSMCKRYGGCPYQDRCNLSPMERIKSVMSTEDLLSQLQAQTAAQGEQPAQPTAPVPAPVPTPTPASAPAPQQTLMAALQAQGINPPAATVPETQGVSWAPGQAPAPAPLPAAPPPPSPVIQPPAQAEQPEQPTKRGRPPTKKGFTLCINCVPMGTKVVDAMDYIRTAEAIVRQELNVLDWAMVEYGKGGGSLRTAVAAALEQTPITNSALVAIDTRVPAGRESLSVFLERAGTVIRGT